MPCINNCEVLRDKYMNSCNTEQTLLKSQIAYLYSPMHSDVLVHWTGRDIVCKYQKKYPHNDLDPNAKEYPPEVVTAYLDRLKSLLKHGLWLTEHQNGDDYIFFNEIKFKKPKVPRVCFTELKIGSSMWHAKKFGALGIGFKRFYLFNRGGGPVFYLSHKGKFHHFFMPPKDLDQQTHISSDYASDEKYVFFKNMSSPEDMNAQGFIPYDLYEEAEWRVICSEKMEKDFPGFVKKYFDNPLKKRSKEFKDIYMEAKSKPKYLMPIDPWISLIVYPNLQVKNAATKDKEIIKLLKNVPKNKRFPIYKPERENNIVEMDIGMIRNF
jgi:hypothetical protein